MEKSEYSVLSFEEVAESHEELDRKEKIVIDFIDKNPGVTKQDVIRALDGQLSRVTIFDVLKELDEIGIVDVKKEKPNSLVHRLYFNKNSLLIMMIEQFDKFQENYLLALKKLNSKGKEGSLTTEERKELNIIIDFLFVFYVTYIRGYAVWTLLFLTQEAHSNKNLMNRLRTLIFNRLQDTLIIPMPFQWPMSSILEVYSVRSNISMLEMMKAKSEEYGIDKELNRMIKLVDISPFEIEQKGYDTLSKTTKDIKLTIKEMNEINQEFNKTTSNMQEITQSARKRLEAGKKQTSDFDRFKPIINEESLLKKGKKH